MAQSTIAIVILTFNSANVIADTLAQVSKISPAIFVVDSGSTDATLAILTRWGCRVEKRDFRNYADQRNWAISWVANEAEWQLHLDADELLDDLLVREICAEINSSNPADGYLLLRKTYFMGKLLRFGACDSWHLRLFRSDSGRCEDRLYDQHFIGAGRLRRLHGIMHDKNVGSLGEWVARHNRWSELEAEQVLLGECPGVELLQPNLFGDPRQRRRSFKSTYYRLPQDFRAIAYFLYRYFFRLGILDGRAGLYYAVFQALWFRLLVDAKITELKQKKAVVA